MRTVFWLTSVTLVAGAVATIAVADYVYRHPTSILGRWMARVVDGKSEVDPQPDRPRYVPSELVTPSPAELAAMAQLAGIEEPQAPRFPDSSDLGSNSERDDFEHLVISLNSGVVTSDLDIPIRSSRVTPAPASPVSQATLRQIEQIKQEYGGRGYKLQNERWIDEEVRVRVINPRSVTEKFSGMVISGEEEVEVLTVMPRRIPKTERWIDEQGRERIGIDFEVELLPHPVKELFEEKTCVDCPACPCLSICKSLGHCLFGWMVGMDCLEDCRHAGVECPVPHPADWRGPRLEVNIGECASLPEGDAPWCASGLAARFERRVSVDYRNKPLHEVLDDLRTLTGLNVVADRPSLEQEGVLLDRCVHIQLKHVKLAKALELILRDAHACYTMEDGILIVTTPKAAKGKLAQCVYPVGDLVAGLDDKNRVEPLLKLIREGIEPTSWDHMGGEGHLDYFPLGMSLVVRQTREVQEQVQLMLDRLRELAIPQSNIVVVTQTKDAQEHVELLLERLRELQAKKLAEQLAERVRELECDCPLPPVPCVEPCVEDDYIEMEAEEVELDLGKVRLRCKGFRLTAPTRVIGMLKGCDPDFVSGEACGARSLMASCKQGCSEEEEEDLVAEFMKYEPNDENDFNHWSPEITEEITDPTAFRILLRQIEELGRAEPETPEKLPVCDHPAICPAVGGRKVPREEQDRPLPDEEIIQADFEVPAEIKQIVEPLRVTVPAFGLWGKEDSRDPRFHDTSRDGLFPLKLDWLDDLHPDTPASPFLEEETIQADFEVPAEIKRIVEPPAPDFDSLPRWEGPLMTPSWDTPPPLIYDPARDRLRARQRSVRTGPGPWEDAIPRDPRFHDTYRNGLLLMKLDWMNDLHPDTPDSLGVPVWTRKLIRQEEERAGSLLKGVGFQSDAGDSRAAPPDGIFSFWLSFFR